MVSHLRSCLQIKCMCSLSLYKIENVHQNDIKYSAMERVFQWIGNIPPITRYWCISIVVTALCTSIGLVSSRELAFRPDKAFSTEPWRLLTSFFYFGDLLIELVFAVVFLVNLSTFLEENFRSPLSLFPDSITADPHAEHEQVLLSLTEKNKSIDYLYFIFLVCGSILSLVTYGMYKTSFKYNKLGPLLDDVILYIWSQNNPDVEISLLGLITLKARNLPLFHIIRIWVGQESFIPDLSRLMSGNIYYILAIFKQNFMWRVLMFYCLGHFWWFTRYFFLEKLHEDSDQERRNARRRNDERVRQHAKIGFHSQATIHLLRLFLLPPWYHRIVQNMRRTNAH